MNTFTGYATTLNTITTTTGNTGSSTHVDGVYPGTGLTVYTQGTVQKATVYGIDGVTELTNPFLVNLDASFEFMGAASTYDLLFTDPLSPAQPDVPAFDTLSLVLQGVINVRDAPYGAAGDGTTDDTAAIQAALTAAVAGGVGCVVVMPIGTYLVSGTLTIATPSLQFIGLGVNRTTIDYIGSGKCLTSSVALDGAQIGGFTLNLRNASAANTDGIDWPVGSNRSTFKDIYLNVNAQVRHGIILRGQNPSTGLANGVQFTNRFINIKGQGSGTAATGKMIWLDGANQADARVNNNWLQGCFFNSFDTGLFINGQGNTWTGCDFENLMSGVYFDGDNVLSNTSSGNYYDNGIVGNVITLNCTSANNAIFHSSGDTGLTPTSIVDNVPRSDGVPRFSMSGAQFFYPNGYQFPSVRAVGANAFYATDNAGLIVLRGSNQAESPYLIMSGASWAAGVNYVSNSGGFSCGIADLSGAEWRVVKTADGASFTVLVRVDRSGDLTLGDGTTGTYADVTISGSNPSSPAAGYVRLFVKADGLYFKLPAGTVVGPLS